MSSLICKDCGTAGKPTRITKGSTAMELILWLCFIVPGLIYSVWRLSSRYDACRSCRSISLVPLNSPIGRKLAQDYAIPLVDVAARASRSGAFGKSLGRFCRKVVLRK